MFCSELNQKGTNILVVKDTMHTEMKDVCVKGTVITLTSFGVSQFKKSLKKKKDEQFNCLSFFWQ